MYKIKVRIVTTWSNFWVWLDCNGKPHGELDVYNAFVFGLKQSRDVAHFYDTSNYIVLLLNYEAGKYMEYPAFMKETRHLLQ